MICTHAIPPWYISKVLRVRDSMQTCHASPQSGKQARLTETGRTNGAAGASEGSAQEAAASTGGGGSRTASSTPAAQIGHSARSEPGSAGGCLAERSSARTCMSSTRFCRMHVLKYRCSVVSGMSSNEKRPLSPSADAVGHSWLCMVESALASAASDGSPPPRYCTSMHSCMGASANQTGGEGVRCVMSIESTGVAGKQPCTKGSNGACLHLHNKHDASTS